MKRNYDLNIAVINYEVLYYLKLQKDYKYS